VPGVGRRKETVSTQKTPFTVQQSSRSVIEHKLLTALEDGSGKVAILATEQDLRDICHGMDMALVMDLAKPQPGRKERLIHLLEGAMQLGHEAFGWKPGSYTHNARGSQ
jgi:hypothetical protein